MILQQSESTQYIKVYGSHVDNQLMIVFPLGKTLNASLPFGITK